MRRVLLRVSIISAFVALNYLMSIWLLVGYGSATSFSPGDDSSRNNTKKCRPHAVFTTFRCPDSPVCTPLRERIEDNTRFVWSTMDDVEFREMAAPSSEVRTNEYGVPLIGDMFTSTMAACPDSKTYTYINGDIIGNHSFVETLEAASRLGDFLMVGQRTDVTWLETYDARREDFDFQSPLSNGSLFVPNAEDYFSVTRNAINWTDIPPFVVGRAGYDNWLVEHVWLKFPEVTLCDGTLTAPVIHQTMGNESFSWGGGAAKDLKDVWYNRHLHKRWNHKFPISGNLGTTWHARVRLEYNDTGQIVARC